MDKTNNSSHRQARIDNKNSISEYGKGLLKRSISAHSEETIDQLFLILARLPSPVKEEFFVQFSILGKIPVIVYN